MAPVVDAEALKGQVLLYLASASDPQRIAIAPALAGAAERAGWAFECYYDDLRRGRHFGGGDPEAALRGWAAGSLAAGGRHAEHVVWLSSRYRIVAAGDPAGLLWPVLDAIGAEAVARTTDPAELYATVFERLGERLPSVALVIDGSPQGRRRLIVGPYLYPELVAGEAVLGIERSLAEGSRQALEGLGVSEYREIPIDADSETYASLTARLAERHAAWGRGVLLGDPELVAAQVARAVRLRLLPLYGRPQIEVIARAPRLVAGAREPVYGRQYDDRDFFALAELGRGLQVVDPDPPFESARGLAAPPATTAAAEPDDDQLARWADADVVLVTLLFWAGMLRELQCIPRLIDVVAATDLSAGLLLTAENAELLEPSMLAPLAATPDRGGVFGRLEPLLASTGRGVAAEALLPDGALLRSLAEAREAAARRLGPGLAPRGWWPLLDANLVPGRPRRRIGWQSRRPVVRFSSRGAPGEDDADPAPRRRADLRGIVGAGVRRFALESFLEERRPFERGRPGEIDRGVVSAVREAGFTYMWSKARFGEPGVLAREGDFVALSLTAGNWDGWSPFYTVGSTRDLAGAEKRLLQRNRPGWLVGTIDSPLFLMSGEVLEHGSRLFAIAELAAQGGASKRLVNVTPGVVARYARILADRGR